MKIATKAIHIGSEPDPLTGAVMPPIYMTSTFQIKAPGETSEYHYTRAHNPNFARLETLLASLEEGKHATVFSSGLGALTAMISSLHPGDTVLALNGVYGGTYRLFMRVFQQYGIHFSLFTPKSTQELEARLLKKPKWLLFETPTNPLLEIIDIEACCKKAKEHGVITIVDNTFASPYNQNPLLLGADIVWHSTTKYISGHSDIIGGAIITNHDNIKEEMDFKRFSMGLNPSPFDVWLTQRGVKTLAVRMKQHEKNAMIIASFLETHPKVKKVYYPGLSSHPGHDIATKQMLGFSGMVSAEFDISLEETKKLISSFNLFTLAESLGGVESLVCHPSLMTHATIPQEERLRMGIMDSLVRFSIGIEDPEDLVEDITQALSGLVA